MEYVTQLAGLILIGALVHFVFRPSTLKGTAWFRRIRAQGHGADYFDTGYGKKYLRGLRWGAFTVLAYSILQVPPINLPGSFLVVAIAGVAVFVLGLTLN